MSLSRASVFAATVFCLSQLVFGQESALAQLEQGLHAPGVQLGYLGAELDDEGEGGRGVRVKSVRPGTPAEQSGLKSNDLIVNIDGKKIGNLDDYDGVAQRPAGTKMVFMVERGGKQQSLAVTLGTRSATASIGDNPAAESPSTPPSLTAPGAGPSLSPTPGSLGASPLSPSPLPTPATGEATPRTGGITAQPLDNLPPGPSFGGPATSAPSTSNPSLSGGAPLTSAAGSGNASLGITVGQTGGSPARRRGAYISAVKPGSPAAIAGLPVGGVIVQVDGRSINSDDDLIAAIRAARPGQEIELTYYDGDRLGRKSVRLAEAGASPPSSTPGTGGFGAPGGSFGPSLSGESAPRTGPAGKARPLINMAENLGRNAGLLPASPSGLSTVYDPLVTAELQKTVAALTAAVSSLEERVRVLEGRGGGAAGASSFGGTPAPGLSAPGSSSLTSPFGAPQTPGFSAPQSNLTPGFGAPGGTSP